MGKKRNPRRDIPYADRLVLEKYRTVADQRDDAARTALMLACIALNDTEGLGLTRITRFAIRLQGLIKEYYQDQEVGLVHTQQRLRKIGFLVDGKRMVVGFDAEGKPIKLPEVEKNGDE